MSSGHTAYDYGGVDTDAGLAEDGPAERDLVVVDGTAMSYSQYTRGGVEEE